MKVSALPKILVTGSAGFVGYHLSRLLIDEGFDVIGFDAMTDYYDVSLKFRRHAMLLQSKHFIAVEARLEDVAALTEVFANHRPDVVVHLAAQAGVRYSPENPRSYLESNLVGMFEAGTPASLGLPADCRSDPLSAPGRVAVADATAVLVPTHDHCAALFLSLERDGRVGIDKPRLVDDRA